MPDVGERGRVEEVDLEPEQVERLERLRDADAALGLEVEVEVDDRPAAPRVPSANASSSRTSASAISSARERAAALVEAGHEHLRLVAGDDDVRLERAVAALDDLAPERGDVVVRGELRRPRHLERARSRRAAVRPVHRDRLPRRSAEELVDRDAERLGLEVEERVLDPARAPSRSTEPGLCRVAR